MSDPAPLTHGGATSAHPDVVVSNPDAPRLDAASLTIDVARPTGALTPIWASLGYDEINWTYRPTGQRLLRTIGEFSPEPFLIRPHYMFVSGNGSSTPHWGSGNVYHEDDAGNPVYDWTILDKTYDAIVSAGHHVLVELGFTPKDLVPAKAREAFTVIPSPTSADAYEQGLWSYPPSDYTKWAALCAAVAAHVRDRYGDDEVATWRWELWNEPDIHYWRGSQHDYNLLYSTTVAAIRSELPHARIGGPSVTGGDDGVTFLRAFLQHCADTDTPLDFVSFHTKGSYFAPLRTYSPLDRPPHADQSPSTLKMLYEIDRMLSVIDEYPHLAGIQVLIDECDASVPAHYGTYDNPNFAFQNTAYYPVFQIALMKRILDLGEAHSATVTHATTWSFYFEGERAFEGTRAWVTADGIEKPLMNGYRLLATLEGDRLPVTSPAAWTQNDFRPTPHGAPEEVDGLAGVAPDGTVRALIWRRKDDQHHPDPTSIPVSVTFTGLSADRYDATHTALDAHAGNSYTAWEGIGKPDYPTAEHIHLIQTAHSLHPSPHSLVADHDGNIRVEVDISEPSTVLLTLSPSTSTSAH